MATRFFKQIQAQLACYQTLILSPLLGRKTDLQTDTNTSSPLILRNEDLYCKFKGGYEAGRQAARQADRQTDRPTGRWADRQGGRQAVATQLLRVSRL